ncbi:MAG TPA: DUF1269 domain-containing protein [Sedimenticola sp.]|nr:DUF1269 domain-containing protein [Sedimenticola sp.]
MRRLYLLLPDLASCRRLVGELRTTGITDRHLHVVGSLEHDLQGLPLASAWQKSELLHGLEIGVGLGALGGLLAWLLGRLLPPPGLVVDRPLLFWSVLAGALFGGVVSALMKQHEHNHRLDRYQRAVDDGQLLLMVDLPRARVAEIRELIQRRYPGVRIDVARKKPY